jgi:ferredoxin
VILLYVLKLQSIVVLKVLDNMPKENSSAVDIFGLLSEISEKEKEKKSEDEKASKKQREELLASTRVKDFFPEGSITINKYTCTGVQCKLCIKACPTNALYWTSNGVGVMEDLCVHCEACVLSCMVDDCIRVTRKREDGKEERFGKMRDVINLENQKNACKRLQRICDVFPTAEDYLKRYKRRE